MAEQKKESDHFNRIVAMYLDYAEFQAQEKLFYPSIFK
jgi:hypothetical protein